MSRYTIGVLLSLILVTGLVAQANTATIRGGVVDAGGIPVPRAIVRLSQPPAAGRTAVTNTRGEFVFRFVAPGRYLVGAAFAASSSDTRIALPAPSEELRTSRPRAEPSPAEANARQATQAMAAAPLADGVVGGIAGGVVGRRFGAPFNTEAYDRITDNQWHHTTHSPLSTFSADVDTASYSNVRRFLNLGQAPPLDAVRIEELINTGIGRNSSA